MARNGLVGTSEAAFVKAYLENDTNEAVAKALGITVQSVTTRASQLRNQKGYPLPSRQRGAGGGRQAEGVDDSILRMIVEKSNPGKSPEELEALFTEAKAKALETYAKAREGKPVAKPIGPTELAKIADGGFSDPSIVDGVKITPEVVASNPELAVTVANLAEKKAELAEKQAEAQVQHTAKEVKHLEAEVVKAAAQTSTKAPKSNSNKTAKAS